MIRDMAGSASGASNRPIIWSSLIYRPNSGEAYCAIVEENPDIPAGSV